MADYYPLIARAVAGLEKNSGEARRALYERARTALVAQLRGVTPALDESEITRERLALEEAIRKVEAEAARRSRFDHAKPEAKPEPAPEPRIQPREQTKPRTEQIAARPGPMPRATPVASPSAAEARRERPEAVRPSRPARPEPATARTEPAPPLEPLAPRGGATEERPSLTSEGLKGFRDVVAESAPPKPERDISTPTAPLTPELDGVEAREPDRPRPTVERTRGDDRYRVDPARYRVEPPSPRVEPERARVEPERARVEPEHARVEPERARVEPDRPTRVESERPTRVEPERNKPDAERARVELDRARQDTERYRVDPARFRVEAERKKPEPEPPLRPSARDRLPREALPPAAPEHTLEYTAQDMAEPDFTVQPLPSPPPRRPVDEPEVEEERALRPPRSYRGLVKMLVAAAILAGVIGAGAVIYYHPGSLLAWVNPFKSTTTPVQPREAAATRTNKIPDRVVGPGTPEFARQGGLVGPAVAQRVVLYEDDPSDPAGKQYIGSAIWKTEQVSPGPGLAPELTVRADVEIPERRITMAWSIRRNTDQNLPASHTIEIMFNLPADFPHGGISNVPGIMMKQAEATRGTPLAGLAVKVTTGYFLIGLSAVESDLARNVQLLKERAWFDVPVLYNDNRRAIIAIEKGNPGERAFADAFAAWGR